MKTIRFEGNKNIVSERVKAQRERMELSQSAVAAKMQLLGVGIDQQAISKIELNARIVTDYELLCLAKILKISTSYLLNEDGFGED
jgi:transcriptional regulator with XRE-family HTH domain